MQHSHKPPSDDLELSASALPLTRGAVEGTDATPVRGAFVERLGRRLDIFDEVGLGDYDSLRAVFAQAMTQAAEGKGRERHAGLLPFEQQPMQVLAQMQNSELGLIFQAMKKANESRGLPTPERQVAELLGAMNYLAGAVLFIQRNRVSDTDEIQ
jgi:hypothetical protein